MARRAHRTRPPRRACADHDLRAVVAHRGVDGARGCGWACSTSCRPPARPTWSATSAPTCSGPDWDAARRWPNRGHGSAAGRSATRCSTSGCWPASARSGRARSSSSSGSPVDARARARPDRALAAASSGPPLMDGGPPPRPCRRRTGIQRSGEDGLRARPVGRPCRRCGDTVRVAMIGRGTAGAHDVLLPDLPGRAGPDRRRPAAAPVGLHRRRQAGGPGRDGQAPELTATAARRPARVAVGIASGRVVDLRVVSDGHGGAGTCPTARDPEVRRRRRRPVWKRGC